MRRIAGIYNYCNRWCERCPLGHRCAVNSRHTGDEEWLDNLSKKMEDAAQNAPEESPDPNREAPLEEQAPSDEEWKQMMEGKPQRPGPDRNLQNHPLIKECLRLMGPWQQLIDQVDEHWTQHVKKGEWSPSLLEKPAAIAVDNAQEVLHWYQPFFYPKISRALMGQQETSASPEDWQSDWNGTAKVVLLGVKHCQKAAEALLFHLPQLEDPGLAFLAALQAWEKNLQQQFPHAQCFIRPGFDTLGIEENYGL